MTSAWASTRFCEKKKVFPEKVVKAPTAPGALHGRSAVGGAARAAGVQRSAAHVRRSHIVGHFPGSQLRVTRGGFERKCCVWGENLKKRKNFF